ncbi:hypothetical protein AKJ65_02040 [candidate division MSBL1 archaeon SCGC-AAA259E19]|uniref:SSD domain-containing protein n=1 Tax=candidate division MSBL1 archaeon SCGC-AAA259E19 TaxID=1698264 RepID=A0A133UM59_9EURY|nr:hypothetical protein AKJ65_02040 [candidate division MSBL1 archaeon SCGC-AAA259E19]
MIEKITAASEERPYAVLAVVGLVTAFMIYGALQLTITSETEDYLPEGYTSVQITKKMENLIGGTTTEMILIEGENVLSSDSFGAIADFQHELSQKPILRDENYVARVGSYRNYIVPILEKIAKQQNISNWEEMKPSRLLNQLVIDMAKDQLIGPYITNNHKLALVSVTVNSRLSRPGLQEGTETLHEYTENFAEAHKGLKATNTGSLTMESETQEMMNRDNLVLIPSAIIVIVLILFLVFRRLSDTALPFLILGLGALWMVGTIGLTGIPFTMVYVALVPIILGIGIDYTVHMLNRYYEEKANGSTAGESAVRSVRTVGIAVALTAITTIIGFASFGVSEIPPLRNFGFVAGGGILYIFILATTLLPSLLVLRDREENEEEDRGWKDKRDRIGGALSKVEKATRAHKKPILAGAGILTVICVISSFGLTTSMSYDEFLPQNVDSVTAMERVENHFGGQNSIFVLTRGNVTSPESLQSMLYLEKEVKSDESNENLITGSMSLADLVIQRLREINPQITGIPNEPSRIGEIIRALENKFPERLEKLLIDENKAPIYFYIQADTSRETERATTIIRKQVKELEGSGKLGEDFNLVLNEDPAVGGSPVIITDIMDSIIPSMRNSIVLAIVLVVIVLAVVFRSPFLGFIGAIPTVMALFWEFGAIRSFGWSLDVMNMTVSALAIGIGVDFSIHMVHRFQDEWKEQGKSPEESISATIKSVGRAITAGAATTIGAFLVLSLSRMPPVARFGELAGLIIFFCLVSSLIVLPSALLAYAHWKEG